MTCGRWMPSTCARLVASWCGTWWRVHCHTKGCVPDKMAKYTSGQSLMMPTVVPSEVDPDTHFVMLEKLARRTWAFECPLRRSAPRRVSIFLESWQVIQHSIRNYRQRSRMCRASTQMLFAVKLGSATLLNSVNWIEHDTHRLP